MERGLLADDATRGRETARKCRGARWGSDGSVSRIGASA